MTYEWYSIILMVAAICSIIYLFFSIILIYFNYTVQGVDRMSLELLWPIVVVIAVLEWLIPILVVVLAFMQFVDIDWHIVSPLTVKFK